MSTNGSKLVVRGDIHCLIVGDPGLGKSQLLQSVVGIAPRGVYVTGSYSTAAGLTVTLLRDSATGDFALEAGALVLGDQGICAIDEFDKMKQEHAALLEAMEQQSVSIAKAGIVCNLPARTAVIAAANPSGGHYDKSKTVSENIKMAGPLLSRFDLVFVLLDNPDEQRDQRLSEHILALHARQDPAVVHVRPRQDNSRNQVELAENDDGPDQSDLLARLLRTPEEPTAVPAILLRKYIGYAKRYCPPPRLSDAAAKVLQAFYLSLREAQSTQDFTPVTTRQLESLIRLAEARARIELREIITKQDALDVVAIMRFSLREAFEDDFAAFDFRKTTGSSKRKTQQQFISLLTRKARQSHTSVFSVSDMKQMAREAHLNADMDEMIESLNLQNFLLKKGNGLYQLQTV